MVVCVLFAVGSSLSNPILKNACDTSADCSSDREGRPCHLGLCQQLASQPSISPCATRSSQRMASSSAERNGLVERLPRVASTQVVDYQRLEVVQERVVARIPLRGKGSFCVV